MVVGTHRNKNLSIRPEVDFGEILKLVLCRIFLRNIYFKILLLKPKWIHETFPTTWRLNLRF